jgi:hypothetical protein
VESGGFFGCGGAGVLGDLTGVGLVSAGVLVGDPVEEFSFVGQHGGALGVIGLVVGVGW